MASEQDNTQAELDIPDEPSASPDDEYDLAIIGMAGRFPGARDVEQFWSNLSSGVESVSHFTREELLEAGVPDELVDDPGYVKAAPVLEQAEYFDAPLFGFSPLDARYMDPQHRQLLELAWATLDNAGYDPHRYDGNIATFASAAMNTYMVHSQLTKRFSTDYLPVLLGSDKDFLATRIAFKLGLTGPALTVQTACSSSLVALHLACQSLLSKESDMALVGAAAIRAPLKVGHLYEEGSVFTPDGHCKPFDDAANGTIFGSGAGMVLVKRLIDARNDNDSVLAVIKGTAINNDGESKADFTAPSVNRQADVISEAMATAGVSAESISYLEAHGTGTYLGDPIEIEALTRAYRADTEETGFCSIGSVKSNIGHLDAAAGMASLIKVVLSLTHEQLAPSLHFSKPNAQIDFDSGPFKVVSQLQPWQVKPNESRRAGITSLGMGGTNAHVILEQAPATDQPETLDNDLQVLVFSAKTDSALDQALEQFARHCEENPNLNLRNAAYTLQEGRQQLAKRKAIVVASAQEASDVIASKDRARIVSARVEPVERDLILMFPGQGSQYAMMGKDLYERQPVFRDAVDRCADILSSSTELDLLSTIFSADPDASKQLAQTANTQPALFVIGYAYACLIESWGLRPNALIGHSIGEYAAATVAGVFDLPTALKLVVARGKLMQEAAPGSMLAVNLSAAELEQRLPDTLDLAVVNSPDMAVAAGVEADIIEFQTRLAADGVTATLLNTSHAFHSRMMDGAVAQFKSVVSECKLSAPTIPFVSNASGTWITDAQATDPAYWADHIRNTVKFSDGLGTLFARNPSVFLEAGPGSTLSTIVQQHPDRPAAHCALSLSRHPKVQLSDDIVSLNALGGLWTAGVAVDWSRIRSEGPVQRIGLPAYPFEGKPYWFEESAADVAKPLNAVQDLAWRREADIGDWFWCDTFQAVPRVASIDASDAGTVALLGRNNSLAGELESSLTSLGVKTQSQVTSDAQTREEFATVLAGWEASDECPVNLVYVAEATDNDNRAEQTLLEVIHLAQSLSRWDGLQRCRLTVLTSNALVIDTHDQGDPGSAMLCAAMAVISKEWPDIETRLIDTQGNAITKGVTNEILGGGRDVVVAFRGDRRYVRALSRSYVPDLQWQPKPQSCFLVTGGFGGVGQALTNHLAKPGVVLGIVSRSGLPARGEWSALSPDHPAFDRVALVQALELKGATIECLTADVAQAEQLRDAALAFARKHREPDIVFHLSGAVNDAPLLGKQDQDVTDVLGPKVAGTLALSALLADFASCRLVLFSSTAGFIGPAGQIDYAVGNAFQYEFARTTPRVIALAWPGWQDTGMAKGIADTALKQHAIDTGVSIEDGLQCLDRALAVGDMSFAISPANLALACEGNSAPVSAVATGSHTQAAQSDAGASIDNENSIEQVIKSHWCSLLGFDTSEVGSEESFFDLGGTSLIAVKLFARLEREFGVALPAEALLETPTIAGLASRYEGQVDTKSPAVVNDVAAGVSATVSATANEDAPLLPKAVTKSSPTDSVASSGHQEQQPSLVPIRANKQDKTPFYLVHAHGGMVLGYQDVARRFGAERSIMGLQSQGIRGTVEPLDSIEAMATRYVSEIQNHQPSGPIFLGGFCMGGTIAWEMAKQFEQAGREVGLVALIATFHRDYPKTKPNANSLLRRLGPYLDRIRAVSMRDSGKTAKPVFVVKTLLEGGMRRAGMELVLDSAGGDANLAKVHQRNGEAFWAHVPAELSCPVAMYSGKHQPMIAIPDASLGYSALAKGDVSVNRVSGSYLNGLVGLDLDFVVRDIEQKIKKVLSAG